MTPPRPLPPLRPLPPSPATPAPARTRRHAIRTAFERAAASYDAAAHIQREICSRLAAFGAGFDRSLALVPGARALDAGCGTGFGLAALDRLCPGAHRIGLDLAPSMLVHARLRAGQPAEVRAGNPEAMTFLPLCADLEHLPLASASLALVWSSLALQWCTPRAALAEIARVLAPGGVALIATLGPHTLRELREAFAAIDEHRHTIDFHAPTHWTAAATGSGLQVEGVENVALQAAAPDLRRLLRDIKAIGAATVDGERRRRPLGRAAWARLEAHYERHRRADAQLPATYDLILLALRKP